MRFLFNNQAYESDFNKVCNIIYSLRKEKFFDHSDLEIRLAEQIINIKGILNLCNFDEVCVLVQEMPVYNIENELERVFYNYKDSDIFSDKRAIRAILETTYALFFAYFQEYRLRKIDWDSTHNAVLENYIDLGYWNLHSFSFAKDKLNYASNHLIFQIIRDKYIKSRLYDLDSEGEKIENILEKIDSWDSKITEKEKNVKELAIKLDNQKSTYNFISLNEGFKKLYEKKNVELDKINLSLRNWLIAIVLIPFINLSTGGAFIYNNKVDFSSVLLLELPTLTALFLFIYFFRIALQEKKSIQSQIMQLELRMALCQFIHNYAEDSESLYNKNKNGFEKFENIIFSPIVASDDKIPTTFDGIDQIAKLIEVFRK
ncbi:hypothetical protein [Acinetobacter bereziniae]|uniref:hypothetical protein n=2 Tax=Acinetobacter bereziniae TaxID=106648 RepID=UPI00300B01A8